MVPVVLLGGRGVGSAENFGLLARCAGLLGVPWGATRAAVDAGWVPAERLVGASGMWLRTRTAVLFGVSGSPQHTVAVRAGRVVAVNTDPGCALMTWADVAVCADAGDVLEALAARLEARGVPWPSRIPRGADTRADAPEQVCGPPPDRIPRGTDASVNRTPQHAYGPPPNRPQPDPNPHATDAPTDSTPHPTCGPPPPNGPAGDRYRALCAPAPHRTGPPPEPVDGDSAALLLLAALAAWSA